MPTMPEAIGIAGEWRPRRPSHGRRSPGGIARTFPVLVLSLLVPLQMCDVSYIRPQTTPLCLLPMCDVLCIPPQTFSRLLSPRSLLGLVAGSIAGETGYAR